MSCAIQLIHFASQAERESVRSGESQRSLIKSVGEAARMSGCHGLQRRKLSLNLEACLVCTHLSSFELCLERY